MTYPRIDNYQIVESIGRGGFGEVFRARREDLGREDAIKILHAEHCRDPEAIRRFVEEARAASQVTHEGIVRVFGFGELPDSRAYCVMELLRGQTLRAILDERGYLPLDEAQPILARFAAAIDAVHAAKIAHRDLKPENLFVEPDGTVRVIDFGLAKLAGAEDLTTTGRVMGSPRYMSPEQCRGKRTDARSDLYSFGALIYHVLVGAPPFDGDALALALHHLNDDPAPPSALRPSLPPSVDAIVLALLDKDPERRPRPLAAAVAALSTASAPSSPPSPSSRRSRAFVAGGLVATSLAAGAIAYWQSRTASPGPRTPSSPFRLIDSLQVPSADSYDIVTDGRALMRHDGVDDWRVTLGTHSETKMPTGWADELAGGKHSKIQSDKAERTFTFTIMDKAGAVSTALSGLRSAWLSHDARMVAVTTKADLLLVDVETGSTRKLRAVSPDEHIHQFSPSGRFVASTAYGKVLITSTTDGSTRELALPLLAPGDAELGAVLVDDDHIVYCAAEGDRGSIRLRSLAPVGGAGTLIRELGPDIGNCRITIAFDRIVVQAIRGRVEAGGLDLRGPRPHQLALATPRPITALDAVAADGNKLIVSDPDQVEIDRAAGSRTPFKNECRRKPVGWSTGWRYLDWSRDATTTTVRLFDEGCKAVAEWAVPDVSLAGIPRCRRDACVMLTMTDKLRAWTLRPGAPVKLLAESVVAHDSGLDWSFDMSPDGKRVVALPSPRPGSPATPIIVLSEGEPSKSIAVPGTVQAVAWGPDPDRFLISGMELEGSPWAMIAVGLDGKREVVWTAPATPFMLMGRSDDGNQVFGLMRRLSSEVFVYERVPGVPLD